MKLFGKVAGVVLIVISIIGCAIAMKPARITQITSDRYRIVMTGGGFDGQDAVENEWFKAAKEKCSNFKVESKEFTLAAGGFQEVTGVIKCE